MTLTVTDLFAGFGGASTGASMVPGVTIVMAANHWQLAVDVHNDNHPEADHACVDLHLEDPRYFPRTDLLWASPECTQWSQANGNKSDLSSVLGDWSLFDDLDEDLKASEDAATRSRLLMFDVLRFVEHHRYEAGVVENVVDIARNPKYASAWSAWKTGLTNLGYDFEVVSLNSMHAQAFGLPAPQSRDRLYIVFWKQGNRRPDISAVMRPKAWCARCELIVESRQAWKPGRTVGKYRSQYVYVCATCGDTVEPGWMPAAAAIDWTLPGKRIGDRDKPLAEKTRMRIAAGIARYWGPFHLEAGGNTYDAADPKHARFGDPNAYYRNWSTADTLKVLHTIESKALAIPVEGRDGKRAASVLDPLRTMTTRAETALAFMPFIAELRGGGSDARSIAAALATITAGGNHHALVSPYYGNSDVAKSTDDAIGTLTTVDRYALVTPVGGTWTDGSRTVAEVLATFTTADTNALIMSNNSRGAADHRTRPVSQPAWSMVASATNQSLITPGDMEAAAAQVDDCMFRMLEPLEVAAGMAFPSNYKVKGTRRERVKGYGNAVTPPSARDLIGAVAASLIGEAA